MNGQPATRLQPLTSAIFTEMAQVRRKVEERGIQVIDLGIGSPDQPPAPHIVEALTKAIRNPKNYGYPSSEGTMEFRQSVADWYQYRFQVSLDPQHEVLSLMGSQDGLAHLAQAWVNPGDIVLVPDPGYPIYAAGIQLAQGEIYPLPLKEENGFLPDFNRIPTDILDKAKMMILNYPNNPVTATADYGFFEQVICLAHQHNIMIVHDLAYSELAFDGFRPISILQIEGAREVAVEFHSLSKSFNMAGCRIGYIVGNTQIIKQLALIKSNIDYGVFLPVQEAAIAAMRADIEGTYVNNVAEVYQKRRDILIEGLSNIGWKINKPKATMFIWAPIPTGWKSREFAFALLEKASVVVIPGNAFGQQGEGYVRIALVEDPDVLSDVIQRIKESGIL